MCELVSFPLSPQLCLCTELLKVTETSLVTKSPGHLDLHLLTSCLPNTSPFVTVTPDLLPSLAISSVFPWGHRLCSAWSVCFPGFCPWYSTYVLLEHFYLHPWLRSGIKHPLCTSNYSYHISWISHSRIQQPVDVWDPWAFQWILRTLIVMFLMHEISTGLQGKPIRFR